MDRYFAFKDLVYATVAALLIAVGIGWAIALTPMDGDDGTYYVAPATGGDQ